ncbi:Uma2 family endonuclease [bacterium]|nr:Uma2 family endonuclease [bacterium]
MLNSLLELTARSADKGVITEDDEPLDSPFQERQQALLTDSLYASWKGRSKFISLRNVGVFGSLRHQNAVVVPDVLLTLDVDLMPVTESRAYFVWDYGKPPDLVIEIVSKEPGGEESTKLEKYAALGVPYYVIYNPFGFRGERLLKCFQRHGMGYLDIANPYLIPELGLGLTTWEGSYQGCHGKFLRFLDDQGNLLLTADERAEQEHQRAEQEHQRAEKLAQKLRDLGLDPDT